MLGLEVLEARMMSNERFVAPSPGRLRVMRDGHNIIRRARIPKPIVLVDTRERTPWPLFAVLHRFEYRG